MGKVTAIGRSGYQTGQSCWENKENEFWTKGFYVKMRVVKIYNGRVIRRRG